MKSLIVYASRYGTTAECARRLSELLPGESRLVDIRKEKKLSFEGYDSVVIGGPIYAGKISHEISAFCDYNQKEIERRRVGLFICCLYDGEKAQVELNEAFPAWLNAHALGRHAFGGAIKMSKLNFIDRFLIRKIAGSEKDINSVKQDRIDQLAHELAGE
ncbi:MAG TPA: flavodoxin domain-containing protein [Spirochaetia bacterium]|nr:flavodoxin domain-containing protein [Spirochaetia bacterium]